MKENCCSFVSGGSHGHVGQPSEDGLDVLTRAMLHARAMDLGIPGFVKYRWAMSM